jgi:hypothetical protein
MGNMIKTLAISKASLKSAVFVVVFSALATITPLLIHQVPQAGVKFLPLNFFVLTAALLLGVRSGIFVAVVAPLISYSLIRMPALPILPQVILEAVVLALVAGYLKKYLNLYVALIVGLIAGRLAVFSLFLLTQANPWNGIVHSTTLALPGLFIQLAFVPILVYLFRKMIVENND